MKTYTLAKGWKIFVYISAPLLMGLFCWFLLLPLIPAYKNEIPLKLYWFIAPFVLGCIVAFSFSIWEAIKGKLVIEEGRLYVVSIFHTRQLLFTEVKGYRVNAKYIIVEPKHAGLKQLKISRHFGKSDEIIYWLKFHFVNLTSHENTDETADILNNEVYGRNITERKLKLELAQKTAIVLNWTGSLIGGWILFLNGPDQYVIIAAMVFPLLCIIAIKYFKGLIRVDEKEQSAYPVIFWALFSASAGICLRSMRDYSIFSYTKIWLPALLLTALYLIMIIYRNTEFNFSKIKKYTTLFGLAIILFGSSYGTIISLNCMNDTKEPEVFSTPVLHKRISSGKSTSYYIELPPWGPQKERAEISVSKKLYQQLNDTDTVTIRLFEGRFNIPWFVIAK